MHGFTGRQLQQDHWREGLAGQLGVEIPRSDDKGAEADKAAAEQAWDASQVAAATA